MKITDMFILPQTPHSVGEQYSSRESLRAFSSLQQMEVAARTSKVSDVVSLTVQAKMSSRQSQFSVGSMGSDQSVPSSNQSTASVKTNSADQATSDYESKGGEAIVQLIEMLTGIKVKLLTQADLLEEDKKRRADEEKVAEIQQQQRQVSPAEPTTGSGNSENSAVQTKGTLRFADGKEAVFTLDMVLPKDAGTPVGLNQKGENLSHNGIEIYVQKKSDAASQDHLLPKSAKAANDKEVKQYEKSSGAADTSTKLIVKNENEESSPASGGSGSSRRSRVIGQVTLDVNPVTAARHAVV